METFASGMWFPAGMVNEQADVLCGGGAHAPISEIEVDVIIQDADTAINGTAWPMPPVPPPERWAPTVPFLYEENHAIAGPGITSGYAAGFYKDLTVSR